MNLITELLELFYPTRCIFCRRLTSDREPVCRICRKELPYTRGAEQVQKISNTKGCVSPLFYEGKVRQSLLRYKFHGATGYSDVFGEFLSKCIDENEISCDIITWAPLSRRRLRRRGYDQARLIAEAISKELGVPCVALLRKRRNNRAQSGTGSPEKRRANVQGVYEAVNRDFIPGARILLVDDIVTTGATVSECARVLLMNGAACVYGAAAARSRK